MQVSGMVERPAEFTVPELINALPSYTIPVTLVCAGGLSCSAVCCQHLLPDGSPVLALCRRTVHGAERFRNELLSQQQWSQSSTAQQFSCFNFKAVGSCMYPTVPAIASSRHQACVEASGVMTHAAQCLCTITQAIGGRSRTS